MRILARSSTCAAFLFVLFISLSACQAETIGVDVSVRVASSTGATSIGEGYTGAGVLDTSSRAWTTIVNTTDPGSLSGTFSLDGKSVQMDLAYSGQGYVDQPGIALFQNYRFVNTGSSTTFTLNGLDNAKTYDLVLYTGRIATYGWDSTFDPTTPDMASKSASTGDLTTFVENVNYVRYNKMKPSDGLIAVNIASSSTKVAVFNGFEISSASVPEPGTFALLAIGMLGLSGYVWRKRKQLY